MSFWVMSHGIEEATLYTGFLHKRGIYNKEAPANPVPVEVDILHSTEGVFFSIEFLGFGIFELRLSGFFSLVSAVASSHLKL